MRAFFNTRSGFYMEKTGTLPQEVVTSLSHIHVTLINLFISSYRGLQLSNFGSKNNALIEVHRAIRHWG